MYRYRYTVQKSRMMYRYFLFCRRKIPFITIECSRNSPPIFTNFYEQAANFDEIIYNPEKYGTIDIRYIL